MLLTNYITYIKGRNQITDSFINLVSPPSVKDYLRTLASKPLVEEEQAEGSDSSGNNIAEDSKVNYKDIANVEDLGNKDD